MDWLAHYKYYILERFLYIQNVSIVPTHAVFSVPLVLVHSVGTIRSHRDASAATKATFICSF
jgi:hypothetical protein